MIGDRYNQKKIAVLDLWERYRRLRGDIEDGADIGFLEKRAQALRDRKYLLTVLGEAKAGKSTLINALLGESVLPTDVLQSSSAVVEIFKSADKYVEVRYADGHTEIVRDDPATTDVDESFAHLRRIAAIDDAYRSIPTALLDAYIVERRLHPTRPIPLAELETASKLPLRDREQLIQDYVRRRTPAQIPVEIRCAFPLRYAFDDLRIVDTPGINAVGAAHRRTFACLPHAHAILFVHSLDGPIENTSFREFITQVAPNRSKASLFLVLTKSGLKSPVEVDEKLAAARSLFGDIFDPDRIVHVDSLLKIVADDLLALGSLDALRARYVARKKHFEQRYQADRRPEWRSEAVQFDTKLKLLNNALSELEGPADVQTLHRVLHRASNFGHLERLIEDLSSKAPELQQRELVEALRKAYDN
ncbi:MAG: dynamin family protein, partial [Myxococcota bacterium]|nr:dynamin family protein [Myxococcota bacterium]